MLANIIQKKIDPRVKRTRALIRHAFEELLAEQRFKSITIQNIAQRAEINRATFYAHFPDKFVLLQDTIQRAFQQELEKRTLSTCHYSDDNLLALIITVCEFIAQSDQHCKTIDSEFEMLVETQVKNQIQDLLEHWLSLTGSEISPGIAATAAAWAIYGLAVYWKHDKRAEKPSAEQFARQVFLLVTANLRIVQPARI